MFPRFPTRPPAHAALERRLKVLGLAAAPEPGAKKAIRQACHPLPSPRDGAGCRDAGAEAGSWVPRGLRGGSLGTGCHQQCCVWDAPGCCTPRSALEDAAGGISGPSPCPHPHGDPPACLWPRATHCPSCVLLPRGGTAATRTAPRRGRVPTAPVPAPRVPWVPKESPGGLRLALLTSAAQGVDTSPPPTHADAVPCEMSCSRVIAVTGGDSHVLGPGCSFAWLGPAPLFPHSLRVSSPNPTKCWPRSRKQRQAGFGAVSAISCSSLSPRR